MERCHFLAPFHSFLGTLLKALCWGYHSPFLSNKCCTPPGHGEPIYWVVDSSGAGRCWWVSWFTAVVGALRSSGVWFQNGVCMVRCSFPPLQP